MAKKNRLSLVIVIAVIAALTLSLTACDLLANNYEDKTVYNNYTITLTSEAMALRYAVMEVQNSVVEVHAEFNDRTALSGSGTIITTDGYIMTNRHVVKRNNGSILKKITVTALNDKLEEVSYLAQLVGDYDRHDNDIAILKIVESNEKFKPASFVDSKYVKYGDTAFMFGNAKSLGLSVSVAVIGDPDDKIKANGIDELVKVMKLNADVNHGNSGGGLFNLKGDIIGVVTYRKEGDTSKPSDVVLGIGYAQRTQEVLPLLKTHYADVYAKIIIDTYEDIVDDQIDNAA